MAIIGVSLPLGLPCTMKYRESNSTELETRRFSWPEDWAAGDITKLRQTLEDQIWHQLMAVLGRADQLELEFGNFGSVRLAPGPPVASLSSRSRLSLDLRRRLRWLTSFPGSNRDACAIVAWPTSLSLVLSPSADRVRPEDKALLREVVSRNSWPTKLVPHVRVVRRDVCVALGLAP